jgi:hypothetical protein
MSFQLERGLLSRRTLVRAHRESGARFSERANFVGWSFGFVLIIAG